MGPAGKYRCPVCDCQTLREENAFEICPVCGWEDDPAQRHDRHIIGAENSVSLETARGRYREGRPIEDDLAVPTRKPHPSERPPTPTKKK